MPLVFKRWKISQINCRLFTLSSPVPFSSFPTLVVP